MMHRTRAFTAAGLLGALVLSGCAITGETKLTQLAQDPEISPEELIGREMTLVNEVDEVFGEEFLTMGDEQTVVFVDQMPEGLQPGDEVKATGIVEMYEFDPVDRERLYLFTNEETANYLVNRDAELALTGATVVKVD